MKKEIKKLAKLAEELGWVYVRVTSNGHYLYRHSTTGNQTTIPATPSGGKRSLENCEATLRRLAK
ncbi:HicA-like toxin [Arthrobacter phage Mufasa8]|uniref:HicA-like antitoxin n=1 Tax=Arthrobacter phage Mufasa8 TaxID=2656526 RepID=A0A649VM72_9CAUD|nr:HicA-like antitoxin [Arthrobacter phage Mufasa8]QGJ93506.1 HicA-like toxin [Arthrobacter phage Mufasa8]